MRLPLPTACLLALVAGPTPAAPIPKDLPSQLIAVVKTGGEKSRLVLVDGAGKKPKELTDGTSNAAYPAWSRDGTRIAFASDRDGGVMHVFVMDADGTNVKQVTKGAQRCRVPSWSADGKALAFCRSTNASGSEVCVAEVGGAGDTKVLPCGDGWDPAFSPDGKTLAFVSARGPGGFKLYAMDADGTNVRQLLETGNEYGASYPAWSPDGKRIALGHPGKSGLELHVVDADGKNLFRLTDFGGLTTYAAWSPDGKHIAAMQYKEGGKAELIVTDVGGKNRKALLKDLMVVEGCRPAWRPKR